MAGIIKSTKQLVLALAVPFAAFAAAIQDPLRWLKQAGFVTETTNWIVSPAWRQFGLLVFAFAWLAVWYHRQRTKFEERQPPEPNMPLHQVCRWIARDSVWASQYAWPDDQWPLRVQAELFSRWQMGHIEMMGIERTGTGATNYLPPAMKGSSEFEAHKLVLSEPPHDVWSEQVLSQDGIPRVFYEVRLDQRDVLAVWPKKSVLDRLRGKSPIERLGDYGDIFRQQDEWYAGNLTIPATPLKWIIGH